MTMMSRVLGFIRDAIIARVFGAGAAADAFLSPSNYLIYYAVFLQKGVLTSIRANTGGI